MHYIVLLPAWLPFGCICSLWRTVGRFPFFLQELNLWRTSSCPDKRYLWNFQHVDSPEGPSELLLWTCALSECWCFCFFIFPKYLCYICYFPNVGAFGSGLGHFPKKAAWKHKGVNLVVTGTAPCLALVRPSAGCCWNNQVELRVWISMKLLV